MIYRSGHGLAHSKGLTHMNRNTNQVSMDSILPLLSGIVQKGTDHFTSYCPLPHRKDNASAEIWLDEKGGIAVCCYDCGRNTELWHHIVGPLYQESIEGVKTTYIYQHPDGKDRIIYRVDGPEAKRIWQPRGQSIGGTYVKIWSPVADDEHGPVVWVEGERCAASIAEIGFMGASSIGGAANVDKTDYTPLCGKHVLVWPDDDEAGRTAGEKVATMLLEAGTARVQLATTSGLDDGGDAADLSPGDRLAKVRSMLEITSDFQPSTSLPAVARPGETSLDAWKTVWTVIGEACASHIRRSFRFDGISRRWHQWIDGTHWVEMRDTRVITDILHNDRLRIAADMGDHGRSDLRDLITSDAKWRRETNGAAGEWWAAMRRVLERPTPSPPAHEIATPTGVVDLRTGEIHAHDPLVHDTMALTQGRYRPWDADELKAALWNRLRHNISKDDFEQLIAILGIAVSRRSIDFCSVLWLIGTSGSGKSATSHLILESFGGMGMGSSADLLARRARSDIDADLADLLEVDPIVICVSEVERVGINRLCALTGGDTIGARRPHGRMMRGSLSGMIIATSVDVPEASVDTGLRRRLAVIPFPKTVPETVFRNRSFSSDELDAVVTLSIGAALAVKRDGWLPPQGNAAAKVRFLEEADPVSDWLDQLPSHWSGKAFQEFLNTYNASASKEVVTATLMGRRISASRRWESVLEPKRRVKIVRLARYR